MEAALDESHPWPSQQVAEMVVAVLVAVAVVVRLVPAIVVVGDVVYGPEFEFVSVGPELELGLIFVEPVLEPLDVVVIVGLKNAEVVVVLAVVVADDEAMVVVVDLEWVDEELDGDIVEDHERA